LLANVARQSQAIRDGLAALDAELGLFAEIRGRGLMLGAQLHEAHAGKAGEILDAASNTACCCCRRARTCCVSCPALNIADADIAEGLARLRAALVEFVRGLAAVVPLRKGLCLSPLRPQTPRGGGDRGIDDRVIVGTGHEAGLERRRRQVHAALQHRVEEAIERGRIACDRLRVGVDLFGTEEQPEHRTDPGGGERDASLARRGFEAVAERMRATFEFGMEAGAWISSSIASPAAIATGLPLSVPAW
jgi:hypothetical protein